ncbi:hypothetical protein QBC38DRAFT_441576 [Podospora fimiseda]|uniref:Secreted protein n=1 Tax=Podospora fimiseda TaxID=252190 RepID=A0AAN7BU58_9PEZI|nr:hypothetical protein QBC38DRAFT_441576 [Podospora fimiseda]
MLQVAFLLLLLLLSMTAPGTRPTGSWSFIIRAGDKLPALCQERRGGWDDGWLDVDHLIVVSKYIQQTDLVRVEIQQQSTRPYPATQRYMAHAHTSRLSSHDSGWTVKMWVRWRWGQEGFRKKRRERMVPASAATLSVPAILRI